MKTLLLILVLAQTTFAQTLPNKDLTPGAIRSTNTQEICHTSTRDFRHTTPEMKKQVCAEYGVTDCPHQGKMELDHLIPLELGGADTVDNLWVQLAPDYHWKDALENYLHLGVCAGRIQLGQAQSEIREDWFAAYNKYGLDRRSKRRKK